MKNFIRAIRMALKYRWSIVIAVFSSAMVALLWGANIGAVYPFFEVVLDGKSMHQWVDQELAETADATQSVKQRTALLQTALEAKRAGTEPIFDPEQSQQLTIKKGSASAKILSVTTLNAEQLVQQLESASRQTAEHEKRNAWLLSIEPLIKRYLPDSPFLVLVLIIGLLVVGTLLKSFFLLINMVFVARVSHGTVLDLQNEFFRKTLHMDLATFGEQGTGDLTGRIRVETEHIGKSLQTLLGKTMREPLKMGVCIVGAAYVNWRLLLFSMLVVPLAAYLMFRLTSSIKRANRRVMEESAKLMDRLFEALTHIKIVKSNNMEGHERSRFNQTTKDVYGKGMKIALYNSFFRINNELVGVFVVSFSILAGGYLVLNQETHIWGVRLASYKMQFSDLLLFYALVIGISDPLRKMSDVYNSFQSGIVASDRIFPILDLQPTVTSPTNPLVMPSEPALLEFENVAFYYTPENQILDRVSFSLQPGESIAIVGTNGSGKSTLINLLPRFFDPTHGTIKLAGNDIRNYSIRDLRRHISLVTQQTMLFNDTIANNIRYGIGSVTDQQVEKAAIQARAHDFITNELKDGYQTLVGEHGDRLSGGQRQRISLARAILKDAPLLILDEATSQIDPESEQLIHNTLETLIKDRSVIMITHRSSTIDLADKILVLDSGQVVDFASHTELLDRCEAYRRFRNLDYREIA